MMTKPFPGYGALIAAMVIATPAIAGNSLIGAGQPVAVAKSTLTVIADREWNKLGARPGRHSETWTLDGDGLNDLTFYGGIESGRTLFREVSKKTRPLPRFSSTMLLTDIPALVEQSYRIALGTPLMTIDSIEPSTFAGAKGVRFTYSFTKPGEEVQRSGQARAAIIRGKLYMMSFEAPTIHFYARDFKSFDKVAATARLQ